MAVKFCIAAREQPLKIVWATSPERLRYFPFCNLHSMFLRIICMASLTHVLERMQKKEKPLWHLHRSSEIESVDELQFRSGRWMKPIQHFPNLKQKRQKKPANTVNRGDSYGSHSPRQPRNV